ncbi:methylenetetrahydrofolate reductase [Microbaculum sp. FT89]|uniref:methylenetetrahydrofolate reductase n=1 Tax=Microbaculum sp. FT89 TaxID=3447298 RepID=UPI003F534D62
MSSSQVSQDPAFRPPFRIAASIEATPKQVLEGDRLAGLFPAGTRVYLTDVGTAPIPEFARAAKILAQDGYKPVPHLPARRIADEADLRERLRLLTGEAGVTDVLVVAGSVDVPAGSLRSSMDVLRTGILSEFDITTIGVAGHPEGSPDMSSQTIAEALAEKNAFAAEHGLDMRIVTQFGFDPQRYVSWAHDLAAAGNRLPIHVGVSGPAKITTLLKYAALCGVGPSLAFLKKRATSVMALASGFSPEGVVAPIETHVASDPDCPIVQLHVFPFGGLRKTAEWLAERGSWFGANGGRKTFVAEGK